METATHKRTHSDSFGINAPPPTTKEAKAVKLKNNENIFPQRSSLLGLEWRGDWKGTHRRVTSCVQTGMTGGHVGVC